MKIFETLSPSEFGDRLDKMQRLTRVIIHHAHTLGQAIGDEEPSMPGSVHAAVMIQGALTEFMRLATETQINEWEGYDDFMRRQKVKPVPRRAAKIHREGGR